MIIFVDDVSNLADLKSRSYGTYVAGCIVSALQCSSAGLGVVLKFLKVSNLSWNWS